MIFGYSTLCNSHIGLACVLSLAFAGIRLGGSPQAGAAFAKIETRRAQPSPRLKPGGRSLRQD
jgi:hypothetical protein